MAQGIRFPGLRRALEALLPEEDIQIRLLLSFPTSDEAAAHGATIVPDDAFENGRTGSCDAWATVAEDAGLVRQNDSPVSFGALAKDLSDVVGWALFDGSETEMLAYGPLVDSAGFETTRSFLAGDELAFPVGSIKVGLA